MYGLISSFWSVKPSNFNFAGLFCQLCITFRDVEQDLLQNESLGDTENPGLWNAIRNLKEQTEASGSISSTYRTVSHHVLDLIQWQRHSFCYENINNRSHVVFLNREYLNMISLSVSETDKYIFWPFNDLILNYLQTEVFILLVVFLNAHYVTNSQRLSSCGAAFTAKQAAEITYKWTQCFTLKHAAHIFIH